MQAIALWPGSLCAPAGRAAYPAHWRGATFFSRQPEAPESPAHRRATDLEPLGLHHPRAEVRQGNIRRGTHGLLDHCLGGGRQPALVATRVRFGRHVSGTPVAARAPLDKRHTDLKQVCQGTLGAKVPFVGELLRHRCQNVWNPARYRRHLSDLHTKRVILVIQNASALPLRVEHLPVGLYALRLPDSRSCSRLRLQCH